MKISIVKPDEWDRYERNCPGDNWELVTYFDEVNNVSARWWTPKWVLELAIDEKSIELIESYDEVTVS